MRCATPSATQPAMEIFLKKRKKEKKEKGVPPERDYTVYTVALSLLSYIIA